MPGADLPSSPIGFPSETSWSTILKARGGDSPDRNRRLNTLISKYWRPVYWYLIRKWRLSREDATDLTQAFFLKFCEEDFASEAAPERGRFRTFLKLKLRCLVIDELRHRSAQRRGGGLHVVNVPADEMEPQWQGLSPEEAFDRDWATCLFHESLKELESSLLAEGKERIFQAFTNCVLSVPAQSYAQCADTLGVKISDVRNYVFQARARLREIMRRHVLESVEPGAEVESELDFNLRLFEP